MKITFIITLLIVIKVSAVRKGIESNRRLSRDDFILSGPENASLYLDFPAFQSNNQSNDEKANVTQARNSRDLDLDYLLGAPRRQKEGSRESRILNDETKPGLSIQGFIPIVSLPTNQQASSETKPESSNYLNNGYAQNGYTSSSYSNRPNDGYAGPNDAKFLSAAIQSLGSAFQKPKRQFGNEFDTYTSGVSQDCVCVPFYMCKNGYIEQRSKKDSAYSSSSYQDKLATAHSVLNGYTMPSQLPSFIEYQPNLKQNQYASSYQPSASEQKNQFYPYLPLDERSVDGSDRNQTEDDQSQYTAEVLGRIFGSSYNDKPSCGMLRTCCKVYSTSYQLVDAPSSLSQSTSYSYPYSDNYQVNQLSPHQPSSYPYYERPVANRPYLQPPRRRPPKFGLDLTASLFKPKYPALSGILGRPHLPYSSNYVPSHPHRPPLPTVANPVLPYPVAPQIYPPSVESPPSPPPSVPIYHSVRPGYSTSASSLQSHSSYEPANSHYEHGHCGIRNTVGVQGRVQNLQHDSSSTEFGEYPWQVAILKKLGPVDSLYVCGGTLISSLWIATAAHCIKNNQAIDLKVRLGEWDVHREDEFYPHVEKNVQEIIIYPEFYPGNLANDIALIKLESPIDINLPHITPACIPEEYENYSGHRCWVTGWGKDAFGFQGSYKSILKKVDLPIVGHHECERILQKTRLGPYYQLHQGFLCAGGEPGKDACEGDGGSPLVCEVNGVWKVAGLVSWGIGCGKPGVPGVYVNMGYYSQWIESIIGKFAKNSKEVSQDLYSTGLISERSNSFNLNGTEHGQSRSMESAINSQFNANNQTTLSSNTTESTN